jgi:hypothetical protein
MFGEKIQGPASSSRWDYGRLKGTHNSNEPGPLHEPNGTLDATFSVDTTFYIAVSVTQTFRRFFPIPTVPIEFTSDTTNQFISSTGVGWFA